MTISDLPADEWNFTWHADRRALERGVERAEMLDALAGPDLTYPQHTHGPGRHVVQHGRLRMVVHPATRTVITVMTPSAATGEYTPKLLSQAADSSAASAATVGCRA